MTPLRFAQPAPSPPVVRGLDNGFWASVVGSRCVGCGAAGARWCHMCRAALRPPERPPLPNGLDDLVLLSLDTGPVGRLMRRWKDRPDPSLANAMGDLAALAVPLLPCDLVPTLVTWVPSIRSHRRRRGFEPGKLLALAVANRIAVRCVAPLTRLDDVPQRTRSASRRRSDIRIVSRRRVAGTVLLVDDVVTTGASMQAAAQALHTAGAAAVIGLAILQRSLKD